MPTGAGRVKGLLTFDPFGAERCSACPAIVVGLGPAKGAKVPVVGRVPVFRALVVLRAARVADHDYHDSVCPLAERFKLT